MKMLGDTAIRCHKGCCRITGPSGKRQERRWIKRGKRNNDWRREYA